MLNNVLTVSEVVDCWGVHPTTVRKAIEVGRLKAVQSGKTWLISYSCVIEVFGYPTKTINVQFSDYDHSGILGELQTLLRCEEERKILSQ